MFDDNCQKFNRALMVSSYSAQDWSAGLSGHITVDLKEVSLCPQLRVVRSGIFSTSLT